MAQAGIALADRLVTLQMRFLPVYLVLIALTPVMVAAHRRWGLAVPASMTAVVVVVNAAVTVLHLRVLGYANYLLVWGPIHRLGFAWRSSRCAGCPPGSGHLGHGHPGSSWPPRRHSGRPVPASRSPGSLRAGACLGSPWRTARSAWPQRWSPAATRRKAPGRKPSARSSRRRQPE